MSEELSRAAADEHKERTLDATERAHDVLDHAFDNLLAETLAESHPPDLSFKILRRLQEPSPTFETPTPINIQRFEAQRRSVNMEWATVIGVAAAIAACFIGVVLLRGSSGPERTPIVRSNADSSSVDQASTASQRAVADTTVNSRYDGPPATSVISEPIVLDPGRRPASVDTGPDVDREPTRPALSSEPIALVSTRVDEDLREYWRAIGVEPTTDAEPGQILSRLSEALGILFTSDQLSDVVALQAAVSDSANAPKFAAKWLASVTEGGISLISSPESDALASQLAECLSAGGGFDQLLSRWISGDGESTIAFYRAMGWQPETHDQNRHRVLVQRLAALTMNVDLRCLQCHDSYIQGMGEQQDYWTFAASIDQHLSAGLQQSASSTPSLAGKAEAADQAGLFYELADGRQKSAQPLLPIRWTDRQRAITTIPDWTKTFLGSDKLARGVVNSLWSLIHGQPLVGHVVDPVSAPHHESLMVLENQLVDDLLRSNFDITRTLALVIAAPATRRSVAPSLLAENYLVATETQRNLAWNGTAAFAAARPLRKSSGMQTRINEVGRAIGAKLTKDDEQIVAQFESSSAKYYKPITAFESARLNISDLPIRETTPPVQWLNLIDDDESQIDHLAFLAGFSDAPGPIHRLAAEMRKADIDKALLLHRVWWILQP